MSLGERNIKVEFHPALFDAAVRNHGQYVRWHAASPCFCLDEMSRPNPNCPDCRGLGNIYHTVTEQRTEEEAIALGGKTVQVKYPIKSVNRVIFGSSTIRTPISFLGNTITFTESFPSGSYCMVDYVIDMTSTFVGVATFEGNGIFRASITPLITIPGDFIGEIIAVTYLRNTTQSIDITVLDFWEDMILTDHAPAEGDEIEVSCTYVNPFRFLVNEVRLKDRELIAAFQEADASCTFPGYLPLGKSDLIVMLKARQRASAVGIYPGDGNYEIPFFHAKSIVRITDKHGEVSGAVLIKNREIQFTDRKPDGKFALVFMYSPTFIVFGDAAGNVTMRSLRYAEDKVFPKQVALKRYEVSQRREVRPNDGVVATTGVSGFHLDGDLF